VHGESSGGRRQERVRSEDVRWASGHGAKGEWRIILVAACNKKRGVGAQGRGATKGKERVT
jgi:hypothetical protein